MAQDGRDVVAENGARRGVCPAHGAIAGEHDDRVRQPLQNQGVGAPVLLQQGGAGRQPAGQPSDLARQSVHQDGVGRVDGRFFVGDPAHRLGQQFDVTAPKEDKRPGHQQS